MTRELRAGAVMSNPSEFLSAKQTTDFRGNRRRGSRKDKVERLFGVE